MKDLILSERLSLKKYGHWNAEPGYYSHGRVFQNHYRSEIRALGTEDDDSDEKKAQADLLIKNVQISAWQRERNRSQVVRKENDGEGNSFTLILL